VQLAAGQVAVVTGGASGIGLSLTRQLCERGLRVVVADVRDDVSHDVCEGLRAGGAGVEAGALHVVVGEASGLRARARVERLLADLDRGDGGLPPP
jgi:NAD(P)-dependent dehydrogenase (short-subunit alcohol dehydrogenase family)